MRSLKFAGSILMLALLSTACVNNLLPESSRSEPSASPTPATAPAPGTQPAPASAPGAPPASPAAGAPAALAGTYQTTATFNRIPAIVQVIDLRRTGNNMVMLRYAVTNNGNDILNPAFVPDGGDIDLIDTAQQKKYAVLKAGLAEVLGSNTFTVGAIEPNQRREYYAQYTAPSPTTTTMNVEIEGASSPIFNVPVQ